MEALPRGPGWQGMEALRSPGYLPRAQAGTICSQQVLTHTFLGWLFLHGSEQQARESNIKKGKGLFGPVGFGQNITMMGVCGGGLGGPWG